MTSILQLFRRSTLEMPVFFMWLLGIYYVMILNQHFNIPLRFIPWALIGFAGFVLWKLRKGKSFNPPQIAEIFFENRSKYLLLNIGVLSIGFLIATLIKGSSNSGIYDLVTIYIGPLTLGVIAVFVLPKNFATIRFLNLACAAAVIFLGFTDIFHYGRELYRSGKFAHPSLHRWFSDGYLFFLPWLYLGFFSTKHYLKKLGWLLGVWMILVLLLATGGSRGAMIVALVQIILFVILYAREVSPLKVILPLGILLGAGFLGAYQFAYDAISASIKKGIFVGDRMNDAWIPVIDFIRQEFWLGHGFGRAAWDQAYKLFLSQHIGWPGINYGGPHNQFLDVAFIGGIFAAIAYCAACFWIVKILFSLARKSSPQIAGAALAALCSFVGLYLVRSLVESIRWEPLGIILTWCLLLSYLHQREVAKT